VGRDLEQFFDRGYHDVLMSWAPDGGRTGEGTVIHRFLHAGVWTLGGRVEPTAEGTPTGEPRSPLRANLRLDERDQELETRGHRFASSADEANS
jgi:retron-type reverse transcriptase